MKTTVFFLYLISLLFCPYSWAQTVSTFISEGSGIDESLFTSSSGELYGTGYGNGTLNTFTTGNSIQLLDSLINPSEMTELSNGMIAVTESQGNRVVLFNPLNQSRQILTSAIPNPAGIIKMPGSDTVLVSSTSTNKIYCVSSTGDTSLFLSNNILNTPVSMAWDASNNLYIANYSTGQVVKVLPNDSIIPFCNIPTSSLGHIISLGNSIFATGVFSHKIYKIEIGTSDWIVYSGSSQGSSDGSLSSAQFNSPNGITASVTGDSLFISEYNTQAIRLISGISGALGRNEITHLFSSQSVEIWPNPVGTELFVQFNLIEESLTIQLFDLYGSILFSDLMKRNITKNTFQVEVPNSLSEGIYLIHFTGKSMSHTKKIVINNE